MIVKTNVKRWFFDRTAVLERVDAATRKGLGWAGARIRKTTRTDVLRRRRRPSKPGRPPHVHSRSRFASLRNILYAYEPIGGSVVVGVVGLGRRPTPDGKTLPETLEHGGRVRAHLPGGLEVIRTLAARPFMREGLRRELAVEGPVREVVRAGRGAFGF